MNKKYLSMITVAITLMMTILIQGVVFAEGNLKDIEKHWANKEIKEMVDSKIILGYPDGTFRPDKPVTKLDSLILAARILGVDKAANSEEAIAAEEAYKTILSSYNIYGKKEISYLLNKKIFTKTEIDTYIKGASAKQNLKRYEAAVIFTKILGLEKDIKNKTFIVLPFMDSQQIPMEARPYVQLMNEKEIMKGISKNEFRPNDDVTRAQVAVLLLRVSKQMGTITPTVSETTFSGTIDYVNNQNYSVIIKNASTSKTFTALTSTPVKIDNESSTFSALEKGQSVAVKTSGTEIVEISATARKYTRTLTVVISSIATTPAVRIGVKENRTAENVDYYDVDDYLTIVKDGNNVTVSALDSGDYGTIYLVSANKIGKIIVEDSTKKIQGTIENISIEDKVYITVKEDGKSAARYEVASDVVVKRNSVTATMKEIKVGDEANIELDYGIVKEIKATSEVKELEGTIEEILIAKTPKITIKVGTKTTAYTMTNDALIKVDGEIGTIYDLRLGTKATVEIDNSVAVKVTAEKKAETLEIRGKIKLINLSLGLITIETADTNSSQIYVQNATTKVNNIVTSESIRLSALKEDQDVIAYGKNDRGVFVTSLIVVTSED